MKIFLDANILFSASNLQSRVGEFVDALVQAFECVTSSYVMDEAMRNLAKAFPDRVPALESLAARIHLCDDQAELDAIRLRAKDMPVLAGAVAAHATHLLTGDLRDFGPFLGTRVQGVKIVTVTMLSGEITSLAS